MRTQRQPLSAEDLIKQLSVIQQDLADIKAELQALNGDHYISGALRPLLVAAIRQSGFAADHCGNAVLLASAPQSQQEGNQ